MKSSRQLSIYHVHLAKPLQVQLYSVDIIGIYHKCESRIEKSVPRIAAWHHKACQVMTNSDWEGQIFLYKPSPE